MATSKPAFLGTLFRRHAGELRAFVRRRVGAQEAEEVVQEAFLRILQHTDLVRLEDPRAYLYRVAARASIDHGVQTRAYPTDSTIDPDALCSQDTDPATAAELASELRRCLSALDELPVLYRHVFLLHRIDGLRHAEIARALGMSKRTVERYVAKALAHCLERAERGCE